jgi:ABC-type phosphate transport system substrate-binding protein
MTAPWGVTMGRGVQHRLIAITLVLLLLRPPSAPAQAGFHTEFKVIVNASQTASTIDKAVLADIFQAKSTRWRDGSRIVPVDHSTQSPLRVTFTREVLGLSMAAAMTYWMRQVSGGGLRPPIVKETDEDVIAFVASNSGSIAYVSEDAVLPASVKVLKIQ